MKNRAILLTTVMSGAVDTTAPTVTITSTESSPTAVSPIPMAFALSESSVDFAIGSITVTNGTASNFAGSGTSYTCDVTPDGDAPVYVDVAAGAFHDAAGNGNTAATQFEIGIIVTLTYQPDNTTGLDTYVVSVSADTAFGGQNQLKQASTENVLVKFPISLGAGATVISGVLTMYTLEQIVATATLIASRVLAASGGWTESSTWNYKTPSTVRWAGDTGGDGGADAGCSVSGTDYSGTPLGSAVWPSNQAVGTAWSINCNATELAAMCSANHGIQIKTSAGVETKFCSCEHTTAGIRPKLVLVVHYLP